MKNSKRWIIALFGLLIMLLAGMIYSWSVLSGFIAAEYPEWTKAQLSLTFTFLMFAFAIGQLVCGLMAGRFKPRTLIISGAVLMLSGFIIAANMHTITVLIISFGILCGFGSGLAFNGVMSSVTKWFPERQGFISGTLLMGFGFSSFFIGKLFQALTPAVVGAWRKSFIVMGVICAVVLLLGSLFIRLPDGTVTAAASKKKTVAAVKDKTPGEMLKTPIFWTYYLWTTAVGALSLTLIGHASGVCLSANGSLNAGTVATLVGLISIANGIGRFLAGWAYDSFGRRASMAAADVIMLLGAAALYFALKSGSTAILVVGFVFTGLVYGSSPVFNSAISSSNFGMKHFAVNFPIINSCLLPASFASTVSGAMYDKSGSYMSVVILVACIAVFAVLCSVVLSITEKKAK